MKKYLLASCLLFVVASAPAFAQPGGAYRSSREIAAYDQYGRPNPDAFEWTGLSLGINGGTLGYGAELNYHLLDWLNIRGGLHIFNLTYKDTIDQVDVTYDFEFNGLLLTLDFYPGLMRGFRISAGAGFNDHSVPISGKPRAGGTTIRGEAEYDSIAPYIGIGWGNPVQPDSAFTFTFDLGLMLQDYTLKGADIPAGLRSDIEDVLDYAKIYPVIMFGLHYHF
jgi:opacity protein-like surface antigen